MNDDFNARWVVRLLDENVHKLIGDPRAAEAAAEAQAEEEARTAARAARTAQWGGGYGYGYQQQQQQQQQQRVSPGQIVGACLNRDPSQSRLLVLATCLREAAAAVADDVEKHRRRVQGSPCADADADADAGAGAAAGEKAAPTESARWLLGGDTPSRR